MANFTLNWSPGANSTGQYVDYKLASATAWTQYGNQLAGTVTTVTIPDLLNNTVYNFRVRNLCGASTSNGNSSSAVVITCPTPITITKTSNSMTFSFSHLGGNITKYEVRLFNASNVEIGTVKTFNSPSGTIQDTFTGLTASTTYQVRVTVFASYGSYENTKICLATATPTNAATTTCSPVTDLVVSGGDLVAV